MFQVQDIIDDARRVVGVCDQALLFNWISDAIALIANKGQFDPYIGFLDICVQENIQDNYYYVTLPREVGTILGITACGRPTLGRNDLFAFHLNGPGERRRNINWVWDDRGLVCTYADLKAPRKLVATLQRPQDTDCELVVYGYDAEDNWIRQERGGSWQDGYQIPTVYGVPVPDSGMPLFKRITRVRKSQTVGTVKLWTVDGDANFGLIAVYEPDETEPVFRRIRLNKYSPWIRVAYRKNNPRVSSLYERIPLRSRLALLLALRAVKAYAEHDLAMAHGFEADAFRLETEAQSAYENVTFGPVQVVTMGNTINDTKDYIIH